MAINAETQAALDELRALILSNAEARNSSDLQTAAILRRLQQAVDGGGVVAPWATQGNAENIPAAKLAASEAGLYTLAAAYSRSPAGELTGGNNPLVSVDSANRFVIAADGPYRFAADQSARWSWNREDATIFEAETPSLGPEGFLAGDVVAVSSASALQLRVVRYGAVPTPVASVRNLAALIAVGNGMEARVEDGQLRLELSQHADFIRRVAWRNDANFTAADFRGQAYTTSSFPMPSRSARGFLGFWVEGADRTLHQIALGDILATSRFERLPLTLGNSPGSLYRSRDFISEDFGGMTATLT